LLYCQSPYMVWAIGGEPITLPENVGIPIGEDAETSYFLFEIHYDNPELLKGRLDSSGLRLYVSKNLRKYDADIATIGSVTDFRLLIPPRQELTVAGHCHPSCYQDKITAEGIHIFAALLHGHNIAKKIRVRHFRGDTEFEPIIKENNFDFNLQDFQQVGPGERTVLSGDHLTVECTFISLKRENATLGGYTLGEHEQCLAYLLYYPRMKGSRPCLSGLTPSTVLSISGVEEIEGYKVGADPIIKSPKKYAGQSLTKYLTTKLDWDDDLIKESQYLIRYGRQHAQCYSNKVEGSGEDVPELVGYPTPLTNPFVERKLKCKRNHEIPTI